MTTGSHEVITCDLIGTAGVSTSFHLIFSPAGATFAEHVDDFHLLRNRGVKVEKDL